MPTEIQSLQVLMKHRCSSPNMTKNPFSLANNTSGWATIRPQCVVTSLLFNAERVEMLSRSTANLLIRIRTVLCCLFLILAVFCEAYTVLAIALDRFVPT